MMTLEKIYNELGNMNLKHEDEIALINLIGEFGRDEYSRGFERSDEMNKHFKEQLETL